MGFNKKNIITAVIGGNDLKNNIESFKNELLQNPKILNVSFSSGKITDIGWISDLSWEGKGENDIDLFYRLAVDYDFFDLYEMTLISGRKFSREFGEHFNSGIIINETASKEIGWKEPVGKRCLYMATNRELIEGEIMGIVKDFHFDPMFKEIKPIYIHLNTDPEFNFFLSAKIHPDDVKNTITFLKDTWKKYSSDYPFNYTFVDENIEKLYKTEYKLGNFIKYFTLLAIFIACLGLLGLTSFMTEQRTKEIGIRKVLGAPIARIVMMLSKNLILWVIIASLISCPITLYLLSRWLQNFVYRTTLSWWIFVLSIITAIVIAFLTISFQSFRSAKQNPADTLKYE